MPHANRCFVIMPFRPELNFFYLYLKKHLHEKLGVELERADDKVLTKPMMEKIRGQIQSADFVIGDITGRNANVFYELGLADAYGKPAILLTAEAVEDAPADVRHLEFVKYDLSNAEQAIGSIEGAVQHLVSERFVGTHERAIQLLRQFNADTRSNVPAATIQMFVQRLIIGERTAAIPDESDPVGFAQFMLPRIVADSSEAAVMKSIVEWLQQLSEAAGDSHGRGRSDGT